MRRIVGLNRILGLLLLAVSLQAVCPAIDYNPRLELFSPTAAPADVQRSKPRTVTSWASFTDTSSASSELRASVSRSQSRKGQTVHAAIPIYQLALPAADDPSIVDEYTPSFYSSCFVPRTLARGPPRINA